jgi:carboxyl-terminal processing protease
MKTLKKISLVLVIGATTYGFTTYKNDFFEIAKHIEIFTNLYKEINMNYVDEVSPSKLMTSAIRGMLKDLDPYTVYWDEQQIQNARIKNSGRYTGIGATIEANKTDVLLKNITKGSAADKAGLRIGDKIIKIGDINVSEYAEDAGELLKGSANSEITLQIERNTEPKTIVLKRSTITKKAVPFYKLLNKNTGYIVLSKFARTASGEVIEALQELKKQGANQLILDLRNNPGGLLSEAVNVSNIFLEKGTIITFTKSAIEDYNETYATQNKAIDTQIPLAILINEKSASASEIVAGSLQDLDRGVIIGSRSYGKGLVQRPKQLNYGTQAKITISRYFTPSGRCIQALDYKSGESVRKTKENYREFKTRNGRSVFDAGGIKPDIEISIEKENALLKALQKKNMIFNFSVNFRYEHKNLDMNTIDVDDGVFEDFESYISKNNFEFESETDKKVKELITSAEKENYLRSLEPSLKNLRKQIRKQKSDLFYEQEETIKQRITEHLLRQLGYDEAVYTYYTEKGEVIKEAMATLNNQKKYKTLLGFE